MKSLHLLILCLLLQGNISSLAADELNFILNANIGFDNRNSGQIIFMNSEKLQVFASFDVTDGVAFRLAGFYQFSFAVPFISETIVMHNYNISDLALDINLPKALGENTALSINIGRQFFNDFSNQVLVQKLDGVLAQLKISDSKIRLGIATSALQFRQENTILLSSKDRSEYNDPNVILAPARLIGLLDWQISNYLPNQNFSLGLLGQLDLRDTYMAGDLVGQSKSVPINTAYLGMGFEGRLSDTILYKIFLWGELGSSLANNGSYYREDLILSMMGDVTIRFLLKEALSSRLELGANISTGDADFIESPNSPAESNKFANNNFFSAISNSGPKAYVLGLAYGNTLVPRVSYYFKPIATKPGNSELDISIDYFAFIRLENGYISEDILLPATNQFFLGNEFDLKIDIRLVSDLGLGISCGVFMPNTQAVSKPITWKAGIECSLGI